MSVGDGIRIDHPGWPQGVPDQFKTVPAALISVNYRVGDPVIEHGGRNDIRFGVLRCQIIHRGVHVHEKLQLDPALHKILVKVQGAGFVIQYFDENAAILSAQIKSVNPAGKLQGPASAQRKSDQIRLTAGTESELIPFRNKVSFLKLVLERIRASGKDRPHS